MEEEYEEADKAERYEFYAWLLFVAVIVLAGMGVDSYREYGRSQCISAYSQSLRPAAEIQKICNK